MLTDSSRPTNINKSSCELHTRSHPDYSPDHDLERLEDESSNQDYS